MGTTSTTRPNGSGLGSNGNGSIDDGRDLADSGGPAWVLPAGVALLGAALAGRRLLTR
jgi:hypothetical protein